jgi:hypothetical protein
MELVTMGEAAQRMGVSVDTVRRRLHRGELAGRLQPTLQSFTWLIEVPERFGSGLTSKAGAAGPAFASASTPAGVALPAGGVRALRALMDVLMHESDSRDRPLESKDCQTERVHVLLQQTLNVPSPPGRHRT